MIVIGTAIVFLASVAVTNSQCPPGYLQMFGGSSSLSLGATCCIWMDNSGSGPDYVAALNDCSNQGGYLSSVEQEGEYVATASCAYALSSSLNSDPVANSFWVGLDDSPTGSTGIFRHVKSGNAYVQGIVDDITPTVAMVANDYVIMKNYGLVSIFSSGGPGNNVQGYVCEADYNGDYNPYVEDCECPSGWYNTGRSCVRAVYFSAGPEETWFLGRALCKGLDERSDLATPTSYNEAYAVTFAHQNYPGGSLWLGYQDFSKESQPTNDFNNPDGTLDAPPSFLPLLNDNSDTKDFINSYFEWRATNVAGTEDNDDWNVVGALCEIQAVQSECDEKFQPLETVTQIDGPGCIKQYVNIALPARSTARLLPDVASTFTCEDVMRDANNRDVEGYCGTLWFRNSQTCYAMLDCSVIPTTGSRETVVYYYEADCPHTGVCDQTQLFTDLQHEAGDNEIQGEVNVDDEAECWDLCDDIDDCKIAEVCRRPTPEGEVMVCNLFTEHTGNFESRNVVVGSEEPTYQYLSNTYCVVRRDVSCTDASLSPSSTPLTLCPGDYTAVTDPNDPEGPSNYRCLKVVLTSGLTTFGEAYRTCLSDAATIEMSAFPASFYSDNANIDALWGGEVLWTGTCYSETESFWHDVSGTASPHPSNPTGAPVSCVTATASGTLSAQDIEDCTTCQGVMCELVDLS